eukprot:TRINITY_DN8337_c0_g1_i7.p1 TRINITY_DN8337_c0_g1~~TRINITY_DN8337_c0_g1_i7.p1  ORF type:complete len:496 (-),score=87.41 TRINITY_DN8337_c0_g1_i7:37-1524(-)
MEGSRSENDIEGYLETKRGILWNRRYVEIRNTILMTSKKKGDTRPKRVIPLAGARIEEVSSKLQLKLNLAPNIEGENEYKLKFATRDDMARWNFVIRKKAAIPAPALQRLQSDATSVTSGPSREERENLSQQAPPSLANQDSLPETQTSEGELNTLRQLIDDLLKSGGQMLPVDVNGDARIYRSSATVKGEATEQIGVNLGEKIFAEIRAAKRNFGIEGFIILQLVAFTLCMVFLWLFFLLSRWSFFALVMFVLCQFLVLPYIVDIVVQYVKRAKMDANSNQHFVYLSKLIVESITADEILNLLKNVLLRKQFQFGVKSVDARNRSAFIINYSIDGKVVSEQFTQTIHKEKEGHWIIFEHQKGELLRYFEVKPLVGGSVMLSMITTLSSHQYRHRNPANHPYLLASIANFLNGNYLGDRRVVVRSKRVLKSAATWDNLIQSQSVSMIEEKKEDELPVSNPREDSKAAKYLQMGEEMIQQLISTCLLYTSPSPRDS